MPLPPPNSARFRQQMRRRREPCCRASARLCGRCARRRTPLNEGPKLPGIDPMNIRAPGLALAAVLLLAAPAAAAPALPKSGRAEVMQKLADCRKITEDRARL